MHSINFVFTIIVRWKWDCLSNSWLLRTFWNNEASPPVSPAMYCFHIIWISLRALAAAPELSRARCVNVGGINQNVTAAKIKYRDRTAALRWASSTYSVFYYLCFTRIENLYLHNRKTFQDELFWLKYSSLSSLADWAELIIVSARNAGQTQRLKRTPGHFCHLCNSNVGRSKATKRPPEAGITSYNILER